MKLLHLIIENCKQCPYYEYFSGGDYYDTEGCINDDAIEHSLSRDGMSSEEENVIYMGKIPKWCPLPNNE